MRKVFHMLKGNLYCGGNIRIKGGEEEGIAVFSGGWGGRHPGGKSDIPATPQL